MQLSYASLFDTVEEYRTMPSIPQRLYNEVMMLDNFICVYCGKRTPSVGIDHIIPQKYDGPDTLHNLVACCPSCNSRKRDWQLHEVNMQLRFGRFTKPSKAARYRPVGLPPIPPIIRPQLTPEERITRIEDLAHEKDEHGRYAFSANKIVKMVGGTEALVKSRIAAIRRAA